MAASYFNLGNLYLPPFFYQQEYPQSYYHSNGIKICLRGYKMALPRIPGFVGTAVMVAVDQGN